MTGVNQNTPMQRQPRSRPTPQQSRWLFWGWAIAGVWILILSFDECQIAAQDKLTSRLAPPPGPLPKDAAAVTPLEEAMPTPRTLSEPLVDVRVEGNTSIPASAIAKYIKTRSGRAADRNLIREDVRSLYGTKWFLSVEPRYRQTDEGLVLIFKVIERPIVQKVEYHGNKAFKTKNLAALTGLKRGSPFDVSTNREAAQAIENHYREKGWAFTTVELSSGGSRNDREVVFEINEGPKVAVTRVKFKGNEEFSGPLLKTKVHTKTAILWVFGGKYDPSTFPDDIAALKQYYHSLGYFDVQIKKNEIFKQVNWVPFSKERAHVQVEYVIDEGVRYTVRNIDVYGMNVLSESALRDSMKLKEGEPYNGRYLSQDTQTIKDKYGELGRLFASVEAVPRFLEEPGVCDVVYQIDEDKVYRYRRIDVEFKGDTPRTKRTVVLNRVLTRPGELANATTINRSKTRLAGSGYFLRDPANGPKVNLVKVEPGGGTMPSMRGQNEDGPPRPFGIAPVARPVSSSPQAPPKPQQKSYINKLHWSEFVDPGDRAKFPDVIDVLKVADPEPVTIRGQSFGPPVLFPKTRFTTKARIPIPSRGL